MASRFFQDELAYLRDTGQGFGQAHPGLAGALAQQGADPDVERLLEGFAFLTARIRERADDCVPEVAQELADMLVPGFVRPLPAATIVQFSPHVQAMRGRQVLPRGTAIHAPTPQSSPCQFQTTEACTLLPLQLRDAKLASAGSQRYRLELHFAMPAHAADAVFAEGRVRLFFAQSYAQASDLWLAVVRHAVAVQAESAGQRVQLPPSSITCPALQPDHAMLPGFTDDHRPIQEYFAFPQRFLFVDVAGLDALRGVQATALVLRFDLERCPNLALPLPVDALRLHCAPAINLFSEAAIPLRSRRHAEEHLLRADGIEAAQHEIYDVGQVSSLVPSSGERRVYPSFSSFIHAAPGGAGVFYKLRRERSPIDGATQAYLSLVSARGQPLACHDEVVSVDLLCTNRWLARGLRQGDLRHLPGVETAVTAKNITDVSAPLSPPLGHELYWQLLAQMALDHQDLNSTDALRKQLQALNLQQLAGHARGSTNAARIQAIEALTRRRGQRLVRGVPVGGLLYRLVVRESGFVSRGDAYLFGTLIDEHLAASQAIHTFSQLSLELWPSAVSYGWAARG